MITYITAFIFYTCAMIGVLFAAFIIYKKTIVTSKNTSQGSMKIIDSLQIAPKKMLLVVKVQNRKFLIASGLEHTTFLADLGDCPDIEKIKGNIEAIKEKASFQTIGGSISDMTKEEFEKLSQSKFFENKEIPEQINDTVIIKDDNTLIPKKEMIRKLLNNLKKSELTRSNN